MSNGDNFLDDATLEKMMNGMSDRELIEFSVRENYKLCRDCVTCKKRIAALEKQGARATGIGATVGGAISASVAFLVTWLRGS